MDKTKELKQIDPNAQPVTVQALVEGFGALGLEAGMSVIFHSSLRSAGWVCGGPVAVIDALETALTPEGTLIMPTHSGDLSDPAPWAHPPVPESWWPAIRETMPAFRPDLTPCRGMGTVPETFRKQAGTLRSGHPQVSFSAWGQFSEYVTADHSLDFSLGEKSPLARLYDLDAAIVLFGVDHGSNTAIHLAEYRSEWAGKRVEPRFAPILESGRRVWKEFEDINYDSDDFAELGRAYEESVRDIGGSRVRRAVIGKAEVRLLWVRSIVDFAREWLPSHRK